MKREERDNAFRVAEETRARLEKLTAEEETANDEYAKATAEAETTPTSKSVTAKLVAEQLWRNASLTHARARAAAQEIFQTESKAKAFDRIDVVAKLADREAYNRKRSKLIDKTVDSVIRAQQAIDDLFAAASEQTKVAKEANGLAEWLGLDVRFVGGEGPERLRNWLQSAVKDSARARIADPKRPAEGALWIIAAAINQQ